MKTFASLYSTADEELRYLLCERAAIHEFDGRLSRGEAERRTVGEYLAEQNELTQQEMGV